MMFAFEEKWTGCSVQHVARVRFNGADNWRQRGTTVHTFRCCSNTHGEAAQRIPLSCKPVFTTVCRWDLWWFRLSAAGICWFIFFTLSLSATWGPRFGVAFSGLMNVWYVCYAVWLYNDSIEISLRNLVKISELTSQLLFHYLVFGNLHSLTACKSHIL